MPNWCSNEIKIYGTNKDLKQISLDAAESVKRQNLDEDNDKSFLQAFIPMSDYHKTLEGYNDGGYEWACNNWGTKWPESWVSMDGFPDAEFPYISYNFSSPWAPPLEGYMTISEMYPNLTFVHFFDEPGMAFMGVHVYAAGIPLYVEELDGTNYPDMGDDDDLDKWCENVLAIGNEMVDNAIRNCVMNS